MKLNTLFWFFLIILVMPNVSAKDKVNTYYSVYNFNEDGFNPNSLTLKKPWGDILLDSSDTFEIKIIQDDGPVFANNSTTKQLQTYRLISNPNVLSTISFKLENIENSGIFRTAKFKFVISDIHGITSKTIEETIEEDIPKTIEIKEGNNNLVTIKILVDEGVRYDAEIEGFELILHKDYIDQLKRIAQSPSSPGSSVSSPSSPGSPSPNSSDKGIILKNFAELALKFAKSLFDFSQK
ncbi:MAG: hypothetical protein QXU92_01310 [Candidatus Diapherotrites archaeon]